MSEQLKDLIDSAFANTLEDTAPAEANERPYYANPEEYKKNTERRFRMTKEELATYGKTEEGRLKAFLARQDANLL